MGRKKRTASPVTPDLKRIIFKTASL